MHKRPISFKKYFSRAVAVVATVVLAAESVGVYSSEYFAADNPSAVLSQNLVSEAGFAYSQMVDGYYISLSAPKGVFTQGTTVDITKVSESRNNQIEKIIENAMSEQQTAATIAKTVAFDFTFKDASGNVIEPAGGSVSVSIQMAGEIRNVVENADAPSVHVYHIDESDKAELVGVSVSTENVSFEAQSFTEYTVVVTDGVLSGSCGENITWTLTPNDGTLTITGSGEMAAAPWTDYNNSIKKLVIDDGITTIAGSAFKDCVNLEGTLKLPSSLTRIGSYAFSGCTSLTGDLTIPDGVTVVGYSAFRDCSGLDGKLTLSVKLKTIGGFAFMNCKGLSGKLILPSELESIGYMAFSDCKNLTGDIVIPNSVKTIEWYVFSRCTGLDGTITIPSEAESVGTDIIDGCTSLRKVINNSSQSITLPTLNADTWVSYTNGAFSLTSITSGTAIRKSDATNFSSEDLSGTVGENITWKLATDGTLTITGSGEMTETPWTDYNNSIKKLVIDDRITTIAGSAFKDCVNLEGTLKLPSSLTRIGSYAFSGCTSLTGNLVIPDGVTVVGYNAFRDCSGLDGKLTLSAKLKTIGGFAFMNCKGLSGKLILPSELESIGYMAFSDCKNLTGDIEIPNSVKTIEWYVFSRCTGLDGTITIPSGVESVGADIINGCTSLRKVINNSSQSITLPTSSNSLDIWIDSANPQYQINSITNGTALKRYTVQVVDTDGLASSGTNTSEDVPNGGTDVGTIDTDDDDSDDSTTTSSGTTASIAPVTVRVKNTDKSKVETTIKDVPAGSTVTISMSGDRTISKDILKAAKGKNVDLVFDMGEYTWTINGKQITGTDLNDVNLNVRFDIENGISDDDISDVAGTNAYHTISLDYDGPFGFTARLEFNVGAENVGKYVNLYYMTSDSGLEYQNTGMVDADGNTSLVFTHASEYLAVIADGVSAMTNIKSPVTADSSTSVIVMILLMCAALAAFAACFIKRSVVSTKR